MSIDQIILTSKKCGLYGQEGFGVLSCSRGFNKSTDAFSVSNTYRAPEISGKEELYSCVPQSFTYKPLTGGVYSSSLCTFLGESPFGNEKNHICHMMTYGKDGTELYPCDYIGSDSFITQPDNALVSSASGVDYLDKAVLLPGKAATINKAMKFLALADNFSIFCNMLYALMKHKTDNKRIIICDEQDSAVLWIAALSYALPAEFMRKVSFTTYAYDPDETDVDICCVIPVHTKYGKDYDSNGKYYVFDILRKKYPAFDLSAPAERRYFDFLREAMTRNYDILNSFFDFLKEYTDTEEPSTEIISAYLFYSSVNADITKVTYNEFQQISAFLIDCGNYASKLLLTESLLANSSAVLRFDTRYMLLVLKFMSGVYKDASLKIQTVLRGMLIDAVPITAVVRGMTSAAFADNYKELTVIADICKIDLVDELMSAKNNRSLKIIVTFQPAEWKNEFVLNLIASYVRKHQLPAVSISAEEPVGSFLADIMSDIFRDKFGVQSSEYILRSFSDNEKLFAECEQTIEAAAVSNPAPADIINEVREKFFTVAAEKLYDKRMELFDYLASADKFEHMWGVIAAMLTVCETKKLPSLFSEHYEKCFSVYPEYSQLHLKEFLEKYYQICSVAGKTDVEKTAGEQVFDVLLTNSLIIPSSNAIVESIISHLSLDEPGKDTSKQIYGLAAYERDIRNRIITGKLLALVFGLSCRDINNRKDYVSMKSVLDTHTSNGAVDLTPYTDDDVEKYLSWTLETLIENAPAEDCSYLYGLFRLPSSGSVYFASEFAENYIKLGKNESSYKEFCVYLTFLFTKCGMEETQAVADLVRKLNSKRLEQLKLDAESAFKNDYTLMEKFNSMLSMEPTKKSFFKKIFGK